MDVTEKIKEFLDSKNIKYKVMEHEPTPTSEIAAKVRGTSLDQAAKALVFRSEGKFLMCVVPGNSKVEFKKVKHIIKSDSLSLADRHEVEEITETLPGGVPPFGNLFDIPIYLDKKLFDNQEIVFNAGKQTVSIMMKLDDYIHAVRPIVDDLTQ